MKRIITGIIMVLSCASLYAQQKCSSAEYTSRLLTAEPSLSVRFQQIEEFTKTILDNQSYSSRNFAIPQVIRIPVVFHVLYHLPGENISDQVIIQQLESLNRDFRRRNADTNNAPSYFRSLGADMQIEFAVAKSDPSGRSTSGINRKYTAINSWMTDDKMKFASEYGIDAWDSKSYLNIWICNLTDALGYSAFPGMLADRDGVVLDYRIVGNNGQHAQYRMGRTAVHEVAHWLNLRHIWGDAFCGDDGVDDTPKQMSYTPGCPTGVRSTCTNGSNGDMYMNYMDFTADACMNLFTAGQKQRAQSLFAPGGARNSLLYSKAFNEPLLSQGTLPDFYPKWLEARVYPNPASNEINIYFEYDERWLGKELHVIDMSGNVLIRKIINKKIQKIDITRLMPGLYYIRAEKDGEKIIKKFVKI